MKLKTCEWLTPFTYGENYSSVKGRGVYIICVRKIEWSKPIHKVMYVGRSENLPARLQGHKVIKELQKRFDGVMFFFRNYQGHLPAVESKWIHHFNPPYNIIGRRRGV